MLAETSLAERLEYRRGSCGDVLDRARRFTVTRELRRRGLYPFFQAIEEDAGPVVRVDGRQLVMLGSNDYLGLSKHPRVRAAAADAIARWGTSCTGSRLLNGSRTIHEELEERLARFLGAEAAVVFATGYQACAGTLSALLGPKDTAVADELAHASLIDGVRLGRARLRRFRHNDAGDLARALACCNGDGGGRLIVVDGVYSMEGDLADLPAIAGQARCAPARLVVDDAHGLGTVGPGGRGTAAAFGLGAAVDVTLITFSKALASVGGAAAGPEAVIELIRHTARPMLFSASLPPVCAAAAGAALSVIEEEPGRRRRLERNARFWRRGLRALGFEVAPAGGPIVPLRVGDESATLAFWRALVERGLFVNVALFPAAPRERPLLRTSVIAGHSLRHLERALEIVEAALRGRGARAGGWSLRR